MRRVVFLTSLFLVLATGLPGVVAAQEAADALDGAAAALDSWATDSGERLHAIRTLRDAGDDALPHVRALAQSQKWIARRDGLSLAAQLQVADLPGRVAAGLKDRNWAVRSQAASAAAGLPEEKRALVRPGLLEAALRDRITRVRIAAYETLAKWDPDGKEVAAAVDDSDPDVSYWAVRHYARHHRLKDLPAAAKLRLAERIIERFHSRRWARVDEKGVATLFALGPLAEEAIYEAIAGEPDEVRRRAIERLGSSAGSASVDLMFRFVDDRNHEVRGAAVGLACQFCARKHASRLIELLQSTSDSDVHYRVVGALGRLKHKPAIPMLLEMAGREERGHRQAAFGALAKMGDKSLAPKLIDIYRQETRGWQRRQMIDPIVRLLRSDSADFLKEALQDDEDDIRVQALQAARTYLKPGERTVVLLDLIRNDDNDYVRRAAIGALPSDEAANASGVLITVLKDGGPLSRRAAAGALGRAKSADAVAALVGAFASEQDPAVKKTILGALAQAQAKEAVPILRRALKAEDPKMRAAALAALGRFDDALDDALVVRVFIAEEDPLVVAACVRLILTRRLRDPKLLPRFEKLLEGDDPRVRRGVIQCIGRINGLAATKVLCKAIKNDEDQANRDGALALLLARLGGPKLPGRDLARALTTALETDDTAAREKIIDALAKQADGELAPLLLRILRRDDTASVRLAATRVLDRIADRALVPELLEAGGAEEDEATLVALIGTLGRIGDRRALPFLQKSLRAPDAPVQAAALRSIGQFRDAALVPFYVERFERSSSVEVRLSSLRNLTGCEDRRAIPALLTGLDDDDPRIRRAALHAVSSFLDAEVAAELAARLCEERVAEPTADVLAEALGRTRLRAVADKLLAAAREKADDPQAVRRLCAALGHAGDRRAAVVLTGVLEREPEDDVALAAVDALARLGEREHGGLCLKVAERSTGRLSHAAAAAAAQLDGERSFDYLAARFRAAGEREKALYAPLLAAAGGAKAAPLLREALQDAERDGLIGALCSALTGRTPANIDAARAVALGDVGPDASLPAMRLLARMAPAAAERVLSGLTRPSRRAQVRAAALVQLADVVGQLPTRKTRLPLEPVRKLLESDEPELKLAAVEVLGKFQSKEDAARLAAFAKDSSDDRLRAAAIRALGSMKDSDEAKATLTELLGRDDDVPLADVARSLGELRFEGAVAPLAELAASAEPATREAAVVALGRIGSADALAAVEKAFEQKHAGRVQAAAALALGATGNRDHVARIATALRMAPGIEVRAACAEALATLGGEEAAAALTDALEQDSGVVRERAVRALAALKAPGAEEALRQAASDTDVHVAAAARAALEALSGAK